jgi:transposase
MAKSPSHGRDMGALYLICWRRNYPHATGTRPTKEARVFRRAQAVRHVVKGQRLQTVSDTLQLTYSALRKWVYRFASQGTQGLVDRPRSGRPPKLTCE